MGEAMEQEGIRGKYFRPSLWKALLTLAPPKELVVITEMALRKGKSRFRTPQTVHLRPLGGRPITVRPRSSDARVVLDVFVGLFHLPPADLPPPGVVWDLGTNIGLTVAHYATLYPQARVTGLEPDPATADAARQNLQPWGDRCQVITGAVWSTDGDLSFSVDEGEEFGAHVVNEPGGGSTMVVTGMSLSTLLADEAVVDYLKVDIEGAEHEIFSHNTEWASKIRCVSVEIHPPHTVESITADLEALGFTVERNTKHWASVIGRRPGGDVRS